MGILDIDIERFLVEWQILKNQIADTVFLFLDGSNANTTINIGSEDLTTSGRFQSTGGGQTGRFLTGLAGITVLAFDGSSFDIRAGNGGSASQNVLRVDSSGNFNFQAGDLVTLGDIGIGTTNPTWGLHVVDKGVRIVQADQTEEDGAERALTVIGGKGGAIPAGTGGDGSIIILTAGDGGTGSIGGKGGNLQFTAGTGGVAAGSTDGDGGDILLIAGPAGVGGVELNSHGGDCLIDARFTLIGTGSANAKLHVIGDTGVLDSNDPNAQTVLTILGGAGASFGTGDNGGTGADGSITGGAGGNATMSGNGGSGGPLSFVAGDGGNSEGVGGIGGVGAGITITAGNGGGGSGGADAGKGGDILITAGEGNSGAVGGDGGDVIIKGGSQVQGGGNPGKAIITSEDALGGDGSGGVEITTGSGGVTQDSGDIDIFVGAAGSAGGSQGVITLGDGGTTNYMEISPTGDLVFVGSAGLPFAEIYARDNTATTSTSTTKTQILIFDTDGESNNMTPDHAQDHITVLKAGKYKIDTSISIKNSSGSAHVISVEMYKNNGTVVFNNIHAGRTFSTGSDVGNMTMSGIVDLAANDTIEMWITSDSASARTVTVEDVDFCAIQIGG